MSNNIKIVKAKEHNLKNITVTIPKNKITTVVGVSGSGKSSLVYDILYKEGMRKFFSSYSSYARQFLKSMGKANVQLIQGLTPVIALSQHSYSFSNRSTVGTISGVYDLLRLLFARAGTSSINTNTINRSLFSFNTNSGACKTCNGLGVEEKIDISKLIADENKSLRDGALALSTGNKGYIMYSQVTIDVLDKVLQTHGFSVDKPFNLLTDDEKKVVFYGSNNIKIPFGKHSLESRLKWTGITAKPREEGFYKGIIPVMEEILKRDRNKNILKYVKSVPCSSCNGARLCKEALAVEFLGNNIWFYSKQSAQQLLSLFEQVKASNNSNTVQQIADEIITKTRNIVSLGLPYISFDRETNSLSGGEIKRLKLSNLATSDISGVTYIFDEPSVGLHLRDNLKLMEIMRTIRDKGNTVVVVEHNREIIKNSDYLIEIGPKAGVNGGFLVSHGETSKVYNDSVTSTIKRINRDLSQFKTISMENLTKNNLKNITFNFKKNALNTITGVSGSGKSTLLEEVYQYFSNNNSNEIAKVIHIDQSPIGKTSRSNPATYTKLFDKIRTLFASQPLAKQLKFSKSSFSFNVKGGRCENCQGAGTLPMGMHFLGNVEVKCDICNGKRFNEKLLSVTYKGKNISQVLDLSVLEAILLFKDEKQITDILRILEKLGLSYLTLGQSSSTLSGGEAQRIKLATSFVKQSKSHFLYLFDEPTTGLHPKDVEVLINSFNDLLAHNNTIITVEHDSDVISNSDYIVDLGPESGKEGGNIVFEGLFENLLKCTNSITGSILNQQQKKDSSVNQIQKSQKDFGYLKLKEVSTNNLKNIDITIEYNKFTVITGVSGSGKSSLGFDTIYLLGQNAFLEHMNSYKKSLLKIKGQPEVMETSGLIPTIAIKPELLKSGHRSTVGTATEIYDLYRLLYSRFGTTFCPNCKTELKNGICGSCNFKGEKSLTTSAFSFNSKHGACFECKGLGYKLSANPERFITNRELALSSGALSGTKTGKFYGDEKGQFVAILKTVGEKYNIDYSLPVNKLSEKAFNIAMYGTGEEEFDVLWEFKRKNRTGKHQFQTVWKGFVNLINEEFERKHNDKRGDEILPLMKELKCEKCNGTRLNPQASNVKFNNLTISELSGLSIQDANIFIKKSLKEIGNENLNELCGELIDKFDTLIDLGLDYLSVDRKISSLSGGENQRLKLASALFSKLTNVMYILDEPTTGLHVKDTKKLLKIIKKLLNLGNTVIAIDHRKQLIENADCIIQLGPNAGEKGGEIVFCGTVEELAQKKESETYKLLNHETTTNKNNISMFNLFLTVENAFANNLKIDRLKIPINSITAITGVSGSGKSSLVFETIYKSYLAKKPTGCTAISGFEHFDSVVSISPKPIGKNHSSCLATYTKILDSIKTHFAKTNYARNKHILKKAFSFNSKDGACPMCKGLGVLHSSLDFLSDSVEICELCNGERYNKTVLKCKLNNKSIADVLNMSVKEVKTFFHFDKKMVEKLTIIENIGLSYLKLGQPAPTFSTGESMRLQLANQIISAKNTKTLFLFDEPTRGLFYSDSLQILSLMENLIKMGNSIIVIEHNPLIISKCDYVIELGPKSGKDGGKVINQN